MRWKNNNWNKRNGEAVKNRDLWEHLMRDISVLYENGIWVQFWRIPRELNTLTDQKAKEAATLDVKHEWDPVFACIYCMDSM